MVTPRSTPSSVGALKLKDAARYLGVVDSVGPAANSSRIGATKPAFPEGNTGLAQLASYKKELFIKMMHRDFCGLNRLLTFTKIHEFGQCKHLSASASAFADNFKNSCFTQFAQVT